MGWSDATVAAKLQVSRNSVAKYRVEGSPLIVDYACEAIERRHHLEQFQDSWMSFNATYAGETLNSMVTKVRSHHELKEEFESYIGMLRLNHKDVDLTKCVITLSPTDNPDDL